MIKFEDLTLDEIEELENLIGRPIDEAFATGHPKGRALKALKYVIEKRTNPNYKFEDAGKITQADALRLIGGDSDPKE
jgi:hypothetical protein